MSSLKVKLPVEKTIAHGPGKLINSLNLQKKLLFLIWKRHWLIRRMHAKRGENSFLAQEMALSSKLTTKPDQKNKQQKDKMNERFFYCFAIANDGNMCLNAH